MTEDYAGTARDMIAVAELTATVQRHYSETDAYQALLRGRYEKWHRMYAPVDGDQWPEDRRQRPGQIHITHNIIRPAVDTESRVESKLPRITLQPAVTKPDEETRAEAAEKIMLHFLELSEWDVWLNNLNRVRAMYGKGVLKPYYNSEDKRPDVVVLENPSNVRFGWGTSDYTVIDWVLCEYKISPVEAYRRYPNISLERPRRGSKDIRVVVHADHSDFLDQRDESGAARPSSGLLSGFGIGPRQLSDYEDQQLDFWDYWWKDRDGLVHNAVFLNGTYIKQSEHPEYPEVPYIPIEFDHEPGSPDGLSMIGDLVDVQLEMNRALSHFSQVVADNLDPAWQLTGETADTVPSGIVPKAGEIVATGMNNQILPIEKPVNQFPVQALVEELYKAFHFGTGLPEIMFSLPPNAQTAGRALAVQIEASANRLDPRRMILYTGLKRLLVFWTYMLEKINPKVEVPSDEEDGEPIEAGVGDLVEGFRRWKFVAPEITPRDVVEHTTNTLNKLQAKIISLQTAMDEVGVESPIEEMERIEAERTNPKLFPGDAQAFLAAMGLAIQLMQQFQQAGVDLQGFGLGQQALEAQTAQPTLAQEDNQEVPPQPTGLAGSPAPGGGPGLQNQSLVRSQPDGGALSLQQIRTTLGGG